ncbi:MAG: extracellular solute-binding protein [Candidatus Dormibacteraeota bacterium]|nr:extracellular solute-binding protein [Candidatus Dormibacteraeota bacterium]MBO0744224.1 extracellular solute-binding protein [Candidatus Dormibacteraeota bacterium]
MKATDGHTTDEGGSRNGVSRRKFLGMAGAAGAAAAVGPAFLTRGRASASASGTIKFWNMPWGSTAFNQLDQQITQAYKPKNGLPSATYQEIQWANFLQTFTSAVSSNTGPAVSSGGGTQAFMFAHQGFIHYADHLLSQWKSNGLYNDFLPGLLNTMKTKQGYAAIPYNLDMRVMWYSPSLLEKAGASVPTDWQSFLNACAALKKIGVYGLGVGAGTGNGIGNQAIVSFMINNGGGLFDKHQQPNIVTKQNIDAVNFVLECVHKGYVDPAAPSYTNANVQSQWSAEKFGMGLDTAGLAATVGGTVGAALKVLSPLKGPGGKKGALFFPNNIMMYKNTPSTKGSEAFLTYYYKNMKPLWTQNTGVGLPVLKSLTQTPQFKSDPNMVKVIQEWLPVSRTWAAPGSNSIFLGVTAVDGTTPMLNFAQEVLGGRTDAKSALTTLQNAIKENLQQTGA